MAIIRVPGDKSISQRALILASLATGSSRLEGILSAKDIQATAVSLRKLGVCIPSIPDDGSEIQVPGLGFRGFQEPDDFLDFQNSGTGARIMLGVLSGQKFTTKVTGDESLCSRPMDRIIHPLSRMGAIFCELKNPDRLPMEVTGSSLKSLTHTSPVSSAQVKSALILAGLVGEVPVSVSEPNCSRDHTERILRMAGVSIVSYESDGRWQIDLKSPESTMSALDIEVPGDFSSAAFFVILALLGGIKDGLVIENVGLNPTRIGLLSVLSRMGSKIEIVQYDHGWSADSEPIGEIHVVPSMLQSTDVTAHEVSSMIDEFPVFAAAAACASGVTKITGASELRLKESDRIKAIVNNLRAVGVEVDEFDDGFEIVGTDRPLNGFVLSYNDHRIAMAFGILGALDGNKIEMENMSVVDISFPGFWEILKQVSSKSDGSRFNHSEGVPGVG